MYFKNYLYLPFYQQIVIKDFKLHYDNKKRYVDKLYFFFVELIVN